MLQPSCALQISVVDPHHVDADSTFHPDEDPDADPISIFYLKWIWMRIRVRLFTPMRIRIQILASKIKAQTLAKVLK
jgi:hypothetical protein